MRGRFAVLSAISVGLVSLAACSQAPSGPTVLERADLPQKEIVSGKTFLTSESQALQDDDFANPGYLWVERGEELFDRSVDGSKACSTCHTADSRSLQGVATRYPAHDVQSDRVVNLEGRINLCRQRYQDSQPFAYESDDLLSLTAYVANQSRGMAMAPVQGEQTAKSYELGRRYFFTRKGQLDLACSQCHDDNWGRRLRGDIISQGHPNGYPAYRLEWQTLGSLHRRFEDCDKGVKAEPPGPGSDIYIGLELYLAVRATGLDVETPAIRR